MNPTNNTPRARRLSRRERDALRAQRKSRNPLFFPMRKQEPLRLRTPSPELQRRRYAVLDTNDAEHRVKLPLVVKDLEDARKQVKHKKEMDKKKI